MVHIKNDLLTIEIPFKDQHSAFDYLHKELICLMAIVNKEEANNDPLICWSIDALPRMVNDSLLIEIPCKGKEPLEVLVDYQKGLIRLIMFINYKEAKRENLRLGLCGIATLLANSLLGNNDVPFASSEEQKRYEDAALKLMFKHNG